MQLLLLESPHNVDNWCFWTIKSMGYWSRGSCVTHGVVPNSVLRSTCERDLIPDWQQDVPSCQLQQAHMLSTLRVYFSIPKCMPVSQLLEMTPCLPLSPEISFCSVLSSVVAWYIYVCKSSIAFNINIYILTLFYLHCVNLTFTV